MMKNKKAQKFCILALAGVFLFSSGIGCRGGDPAAKRAAQERIQLEVWSVFDSQEDLNALLKKYTDVHDNVHFLVQRFNLEEYKSMLLDAFSEDRGPDIFALPNTWIRAYENKLAFMPDSLLLPFKSIQGSLKKEAVVELQTIQTLNPKALKTKFVDAVVGDVAWETEVDQEGKKSRMTKIFALPLSIDVLALYYNIDLLNAAGISEPAKNWTEFSEHVKKLAQIDSTGNIVVSGAALGTGKNVERSSDILSLLMMQNGADMTDETGQNVAFHQYPKNYQKERLFPPGEEALVFYTDFANKSLNVYTWNKTLPSSFEAFAAGKAAYFLGYSYHRQRLEQKAPGMNFGVTSAPVIAGNPEAQFANYWAYSVAKKSKHKDWAWDFLLFATQEDAIAPYLQKMEKPTALRALIDKQKQDPALAPFANMVLTAKSWYHGKDAQTAERVMQEMMDSVSDGRAHSYDAIRLGAQMIQQTMR